MQSEALYITFFFPLWNKILPCDSLSYSCLVNPFEGFLEGHIHSELPLLSQSGIHSHNAQNAIY